MRPQAEQRERTRDAGLAAAPGRATRGVRRTLHTRHPACGPRRDSWHNYLGDAHTNSEWRLKNLRWPVNQNYVDLTARRPPCTLRLLSACWAAPLRLTRLAWLLVDGWSWRQLPTAAPPALATLQGGPLWHVPTLGTSSEAPLLAPDCARGGGTLVPSAPSQLLLCSCPPAVQGAPP